MCATRSTSSSSTCSARRRRRAGIRRSSRTNGSSRPSSWRSSCARRRTSPPRGRPILSTRDVALQAAIAEQRSIEASIERARREHDTQGETLAEVQGRYYEVGAEISRTEQSLEHAREMRDAAAPGARADRPVARRGHAASCARSRAGRGVRGGAAGTRARPGRRARERARSGRGAGRRRSRDARLAAALGTLQRAVPGRVDPGGSRTRPTRGSRASTAAARQRARARDAGTGRAHGRRPGPAAGRSRIRREPGARRQRCRAWPASRR